MTKERNTTESRKGAVLNQIMRKMLGEDEVVALRNEIGAIKNLLGHSECYHVIEGIDNPVPKSECVQSKAMNEIKILRKDLDALRSFIVNDTNLMVEKFPSLPTKKGKLTVTRKRITAVKKTQLPKTESVITNKKGKPVATREPVLTIVTRKAGRPKGVKETKPRKYKVSRS